MVEETSAKNGGNHQYVIGVENPFLYSATYLMPRAGIKPTPRTDIGYRPVQVRRIIRAALLTPY
jgi:hypothetical protein